MTAALHILKPRTPSTFDIERAWHDACADYLFALFNAAPDDVVRRLGDEVRRLSYQHKHAQLVRGR